jgi:hypothetical protein
MSESTTGKMVVEVLRVRPDDVAMALAWPKAAGVARIIRDVDDPTVASLPVWEPPALGASKRRMVPTHPPGQQERLNAGIDLSGRLRC